MQERLQFPEKFRRRGVWRADRALVGARLSMRAALQVISYVSVQHVHDWYLFAGYAAFLLFNGALGQTCNLALRMLVSG